MQPERRHGSPNRVSPPRARPGVRAVSPEVMQARVKELEEARKEALKAKAKDERQRKKELADAKKKLSKEMQSATQQLRKGEMEANKLNAMIHRVEDQAEQAKVRFDRQKNLVDANVGKLQAKRSAMEDKLQSQAEKVGEARGRLAHVQLAAKLLEAGVILPSQLDAELANSAHAAAQPPEAMSDADRLRRLEEENRRLREIVESFAGEFAAAGALNAQAKADPEHEGAAEDAAAMADMPSDTSGSTGITESTGQVPGLRAAERSSWPRLEDQIAVLDLLRAGTSTSVKLGVELADLGLGEAAHDDEETSDAAVVAAAATRVFDTVPWLPCAELESGPPVDDAGLASEGVSSGSGTFGGAEDDRRARAEGAAAPVDEDSGSHRWSHVPVGTDDPGHAAAAVSPPSDRSQTTSPEHGQGGSESVGSSPQLHLPPRPRTDPDRLRPRRLSVSGTVGSDASAPQLLGPSRIATPSRGGGEACAASRWGAPSPVGCAVPASAFAYGRSVSPLAGQAPLLSPALGYRSVAAFATSPMVPSSPVQSFRGLVPVAGAVGPPAMPTEPVAISAGTFGRSLSPVRIASSPMLLSNLRTLAAPVAKPGYVGVPTAPASALPAVQAMRAAPGISTL